MIPIDLYPAPKNTPAEDMLAAYIEYSIKFWACFWGYCR